MANMTLKQLRYVEAISRQGHFGRAADVCAVTQPALSMQVKELEESLGTPLFERGPRKVRLTAKGEALWTALADPIHDFYDQALKGLSFDDRLAFIHYISLLQKNMSKL